MLTRCPTCSQWYEAVELAHAPGGDPDTVPDRCPLDGTAIQVPQPRPPAPPPVTRRDAAVIILGITWFFLPTVWLFVGLPLLIIAAILTWITGNWVFIAVWLVVSAVALATWAVFVGSSKG